MRIRRESVRRRGHRVAGAVRALVQVVDPGRNLHHPRAGDDLATEHRVALNLSVLLLGHRRERRTERENGSPFGGCASGSSRCAYLSEWPTGHSLRDAELVEVLGDPTE